MTIQCPPDHDLAMTVNVLVERQNEKRGLESGFGSAGYVNEI